MNSPEFPATELKLLNLHLIKALERNCKILARFYLDTLIRSGADLNKQDDLGYTALMIASTRGFEQIALDLIKNGANLNIATKGDKGGATALMLAAGDGNLTITRTLLLKGANLDVKESEGTTALFWAAEGNHPDVVELLLGRGANPNLTDNEGRTALDAAKFFDADEAVKILQTYS